MSRIGDNGARTRGALQWLNSLWTHHVSQGLPLQPRAWEALSPPKTFLLPWGRFRASGIPPNLPPPRGGLGGLWGGASDRGDKPGGVEVLST